MKTELFRQSDDIQTLTPGTTIFSEGQDAGGVMYAVQFDIRLTSSNVDGF